MSEQLEKPQEQCDPRWTRVCDALRWGNTRRAAAAYAGIHRDTFYSWMESYPEFATMVEQAESDAEVRSVASIASCARGGVLKKRRTTYSVDGTPIVEEEWTLPDWRAAAFLLERRKPEWREPKPLDLRQLSDEQIIRLLEEDSEHGSEETGPDAG